LRRLLDDRLNFFAKLIDVQMKTVPKAGDRYSKPTTHNRNDIDKILATCGDNYLSSQAIVDSAKHFPLLDSKHDK
jgi:hypothetical protein